MLRIASFAGCPPAPRKLSEKSLTKNLVKPRICAVFGKVLIKLFQKFAGFGVEPQGLDLSKPS